MEKIPVGCVSVSEIHRYPLRPEGVEEPLWMTPEWRRRILDHLCDSPWLRRASEIETGRGSTWAAHRADEPVYVLRREGKTSVIRLSGPDRKSAWRRRSVVETVDLWREVRSWWDSERAIDRLVVRVLLSGGIVADLARYKDCDWSLIGIVD